MFGIPSETLHTIHVLLVRRPAKVLRKPSEGFVKVVRKPNDEFSSNDFLGSINMVRCKMLHRLVRENSHQVVVPFKGSRSFAGIDPVEEGHVLRDGLSGSKVLVFGQLPGEGVLENRKYSPSLRWIEEIGHIVKLIREKHSCRAIADCTDAIAALLLIRGKCYISDQITIALKDVLAATLLFNAKRQGKKLGEGKQ